LGSADSFCCPVLEGRELGSASLAAGGAQEEEEEEEEFWSDDDDARADDTAGTSTVATTMGAARAPDGFEIVEQCPHQDMINRTELNKQWGKRFFIPSMMSTMGGILAQSQALISGRET
jgi:hypothetical protein